MAGKSKLADAAAKGDILTVKRLLLAKVCEQIDKDPPAAALSALIRRADVLLTDIERLQEPKPDAKRKGGDDLASRRAARATAARAGS